MLNTHLGGAASRKVGAKTIGIALLATLVGSGDSALPASAGAPAKAGAVDRCWKCVPANFEGFWIHAPPAGRLPRTADMPDGWRVFGTTDRPAPKLLPEALAEVRARRTRELNAVDNAGGIDPKTAACVPGGMPDIMTFAPIDFHQRQDELLIVVERDRQLPRHIYIQPFHPTLDLYDPENTGPTNNGRSIGRWEGTTLVVTTTGTSGEPWMFTYDRIPKSEETRITERFSISPDGAELRNVMTIEDPKILAEPWTLTFRWHRAPPETEHAEEYCKPEHEVMQQHAEEARRAEEARPKESTPP